MAIAISTKISTFSTKTRTLVEKVEVEADPRLAYDLVDPFFMTGKPGHTGHFFQRIKISLRNFDA
jgi:hypothetical protein